MIISQRKIKICIVFGTRPEVIKMAPVVMELRQYPKLYDVVIISTGQHREMLQQVLTLFGIQPNYSLRIMRAEQSLFDISRKILGKIESIFLRENPDLVLVHGDTPTAFAAALSAFYARIPVGHVEAGLRTYNKYNPFPEEMNRQLIDVLCDIYFVPTKRAMENLLREGKDRKKIWITGNTVIDAMKWAMRQHQAVSRKLETIDFKKKKVIVLTIHRRESWGKTMEGILEGVKKVVNEYKDIEVVFPVHPNSFIQKSVKKVFLSQKRVHMYPPLTYVDMIYILKNCYAVVTDSGGLQEEAPVLKKPVLVARDTTERTDGVVEGTIQVVGTDSNNIYNSLKKLITDARLYKRMASGKNPYGDGKSSTRIRKAIDEFIYMKG